MYGWCSATRRRGHDTGETTGVACVARVTSRHDSLPEQLAGVGRTKVPPLAFVLLALQILDLASTGLALRLGGTEQNAVLPLLGWKWGIVVKFVVVFIFAALASVAPHRISTRGLLVACAIYGAVVAWNLVVAAALA
jgi:hypothetical protein